MAKIVRKYGGSSLRDADRIRHVASQIADLKWCGDEVVVVVSAMAATTDDLISMARSLNPTPPKREMDMLLSVGERISCALLAMALEAEGLAAASYTGSQVGIITDTHHGRARIVDIKPYRLLDALKEDKIVVVAGFQGVSIQKEITTLGRGGSDATAVALAAAIGADRCELMKDVDGIFTANPNSVKDAVCIENVDFESALKLADGGVVALQSEAAALAWDYKVPLGIGNSETNKVGTIITDRPFEKGEIVGMASTSNLVRQVGCEEDIDWHEYSRVFELHGRYILWRKGRENEIAPYAG